MVCEECSALVERSVINGEGQLLDFFQLLCNFIQLVLDHTPSWLASGQTQRNCFVARNDLEHSKGHILARRPRRLHFRALDVGRYLPGWSVWRCVGGVIRQPAHGGPSKIGLGARGLDETEVNYWLLLIMRLLIRALRRLTVPVGSHLLAHRFRQTFHRKLGSVIESTAWKSSEAANGRDVQDRATNLPILGIHVAENAHSMRADLGHAPEVGLHDAARLRHVLGGAHKGLRVAHKAVAGVVDNNIDAAELGDGRVERSFDRRSLGDIQSCRVDAGAVCG